MMKYRISIAVPGEETKTIERSAGDLFELFDDLVWATSRELEGVELRRIAEVDLGVKSIKEEQGDPVPAASEDEGNQETNPGFLDSPTKNG